MSGVEKVATGRRRRSFWIFGGFVVVVLVAVLALGWLGFVPGVSAMLGANQPQDLGVQYTRSDLTSIERKSGIRFEDVADAPDHPARPGKRTAFADPKSIDGSFTQEELSAALNSASIPWLPLKDVQVKLSDHVIEISGLLKGEGIRNLLKLAAELDLSESHLADVAGYTEALADNVPVYIKAGGGVENSKLHLDLQQFRMGRFNVSADLLAKIAPGGIRKTIKRSDSFAIQTATPRDGSLDFTGTLPTTIYAERK
jgi:hypothetical protein